MTGRKILLRLSWPNKLLSPNARTHWAAKAKAAKAARAEGHTEAMLRGIKNIAGADAYEVRITAYPPDKRRRDMDNILASLKAHLDGIAAALGADDSTFRLILEPMGEAIKPGAVLVELGAIE